MALKRKAFDDNKAAIELSVTAIVILILAIVMLGLGLGFIRGMFGRTSSLFEQQIAVEPDPPAASGSEPITVSRETIITNANKDEVIKVSLYNPSKSEWTADKFKISLNCSNSTPDIEPIVNMKDIGQGETETFNVLFTIPKDTNSGTYLCYTYIGNSTVMEYSKDLVIKVTK
ncbi:hypothetical protein KY358_04370 [Candidatus Woesearchaeota archaeon]|nr:hypothetical protein [Candidatus Woesearchaeota archaeon]